VPEISLGEEAIRAEAARHGSDLASFLAHVSLCTRESEGPRAPQRISLLTFHAAKGLEFPVVFIAGAEEGITPLEDGRGVDPQEERRLFYVAMTRAGDHLRISHCRQRARRGELKEALPSRFLEDIPAGLRRDSQPRRSSRQLSLF
jgi:DNA helicase-2/ATP-dependent DNA helicase PcrA